MSIPVEWRFDFEYNGGDLSCSALVLELKAFFQSLPPSTFVLVTAQDLGAVIDIPAWCWSTGHSLIHKQHPYYLITKRSTE